ncbi:MAG: DNA mismatch repair endonuclease MutL [Sphingobacteriia bacterium]|nr:DNA mismatch repair endonuclease MutL [Sphingobacteriia bacterium]
MSKIKILSSHIINLIAAGEVVDRPFSVVKELIENSIDAEATKIEINIESGGKNLIAIKDNGIGMSKEDLLLSIERHATSKLDESDIHKILHFGFRGEALPSIASVSRVSITSRLRSEEFGNNLSVEGGVVKEIKSCSSPIGTYIEVRDLFFAVPARLKFLKTDKAEAQSIYEIVYKIAIANPHIAFKLISDNRVIFDSKDNLSLLDRLTDVLGKDFSDNSIHFENDIEAIKISGYISLPTFNKRTSSDQYFYVNRRPIKDKNLHTAIKIAYQDVLASDRYPSVVIFLELPYSEIDVNVHPAKTEIRFRDINLIKKILINTVREALKQSGNRSSTTLSNDLFNYLESNVPEFPKPIKFSNNNYQGSYFTSTNVNNTSSQQLNFNESQTNNFTDAPVITQVTPTLVNVLEQKKDSDVMVIEKMPIEQDIFSPYVQPPISEQQKISIFTHNYPLGLAKCQLNNTYLISEAEDCFIIVDIHAAHERILYEKYKVQLQEGGIKRQKLLLPIEVKLQSKYIHLLNDNLDAIKNLGLSLEIVSDEIIAIHEVPAEFTKANFANLVKDIAEDIEEMGNITSLEKAFEHFYETLACHLSIRAGQSLSIPEMNQLLRDIERTPLSAQCNHGRPTYIKLKLNDIEKLFGRK